MAGSVRVCGSALSPPSVLWRAAQLRRRQLLSTVSLRIAAQSMNLQIHGVSSTFLWQGFHFYYHQAVSSGSSICIQHTTPRRLADAVAPTSPLPGGFGLSGRVRHGSHSSHGSMDAHQRLAADVVTSHAWGSCSTAIVSALRPASLGTRLAMVLWRS